MCGFGAARDCNLVGRCNLAHTPACMQAQSLLLPKQRSPSTCIWAWSEGEVGYPYCEGVAGAWGRADARTCASARACSAAEAATQERSMYT